MSLELMRGSSDRKENPLPQHPFHRESRKKPASSLYQQTSFIDTGEKNPGRDHPDVAGRLKKMDGHFERPSTTLVPKLLSQVQHSLFEIVLGVVFGVEFLTIWKTNRRVVYSQCQAHWNNDDTHYALHAKSRNIGIATKPTPAKKRHTYGT